MKQPEEFRNAIDKKFEVARAKGISRMSLEWGMWSGELNRELKTYSEKEGPKQVLYKYTFVYWVLKSQLLELYHVYKGKLFGKVHIKRKKKEIAEVVKILDLRTTGRNLTEEELLTMVVKVT